MEKVSYVIRGAAPGGSGRYREVLVDDLAPRILDGPATSLIICVDDESSDVESPVPTPPGEDPVVAVVSVELPCHDRLGPVDELVSSTGWDWAAYLVSGAIYTDYGENRWSEPRSWPAGTRSPGVLTVSFIRSRPDLERHEFFRRWHGTQSPLSEAIQPRARYVRNEVVRALSAGAPPLDGIVEEAWAGPEVITDPMQFFCGEGDPEVMQANIAAMIESVTSFIDMDQMRNVTMSEFLFTDP